MITKLFTQLIMATTLFHFFPTDMNELEQRALAQEDLASNFNILSMHDRLKARLPQAPNRPQAPTKVMENSMGVVTTAQSAVVMDRASGEVLFEKNIHEPRAIGSITKLMAAFIFLQTNPDLGAPVTILSSDVKGGAVLHLPVGETVSVRQLLEASLVGSDNTAASALARLSRMNEGDFVARMNEAAAEIGMQHTTFADATGLSAKNVSVVADLARMFDVILKQETIREITQTPSVVVTGASGRSYLIESTDELLNSFVNTSPYKILGGKTGFLPVAGYCLGSIFSFENQGEIVVVVLGSQTKEGRFQDVKSLAVWAYETFDWRIL